ncbi:magnetosome biogenesis transporter MamN [Magnetospirillum sp. UT-4]|uniref:magnetosome biogenesis transporter MamN n=1 Tax=Magnetospirillum sp. UT-4 TaxID=2681467 RepID=UPI0013856A36|nr:magnetosome biogenesis transporter MamN [Magnetospirillum sp. UT-4]CAA7622263.1 Magnetosome protein MamN, containing Divalent ion symporter domain [Magnetospirillum sp. UT-4]
MVGFLVLAVFIVTFVAVYRRAEGGHVAVLAGAGALVLIGWASGTYTPRMALQSVYFETLALIFGMSAISSLLAKSGFYANMAAGTAERSQGQGRWILVMMALVTYAISLVSNSFVTVAVVVPVTLTVCFRTGIDPVPVIIGEIIAANLGGASTMIGDFPNMILASAGRLHFNDFIGGMMPVCLLLLAAMLIFFERRLGDWKGAGIPVDPAWLEGEQVRDRQIDRRLLRYCVLIFAVTVLGLVFAGPLNLRPGWIAFGAGLVALALGRFKDDEFFHACGGTDLLFFAGLFVMVGALNALGMLDWAVTWLEQVTASHDRLRAILLMWVAAGLTIFVGGGTTAALFAPMAATLRLDGDGQAAWWALALGIMAGSSASLSGATAGALAMNQYSGFIKRHPQLAAAAAAGTQFTHREYMRWGMPLMGIFLILSTIYVAVLAS